MLSDGTRCACQAHHHTRIQAGWEVQKNDTKNGAIVRGSIVHEQGLDDAQAVEAMVTLVCDFSSIGQERLAGRSGPGDR